MIALTGNMAEFFGKTDAVSMARSLRLAVIQNQFSCGNLTEPEARELLQGPLSPDDPTTIYDDSSSLQTTTEGW